MIWWHTGKLTETHSETQELDLEALDDTFLFVFTQHMDETTNIFWADQPKTGREGSKSLYANSA